jgi:hypothetical protein
LDPYYDVFCRCVSTLAFLADMTGGKRMMSAAMEVHDVSRRGFAVRRRNAIAMIGGNKRFRSSSESRETTLATITIKLRMSGEEMANHFRSAAIVSRDFDRYCRRHGRAWSRAPFPVAENMRLRAGTIMPATFARRQP